MIKIDFFKEFRIEKDLRIIKNFINLYWDLFTTKNNKSKDLVFVRRPEFVKNSKYSRRNCYKHLRHLLLIGLFTEQDNFIVPSSLIFKINKKIINPTKSVFGTKIIKKTLKQGVINIEPAIPISKIKELSKLIIIENNNLFNFISIPFNIGEKISFCPSFKLSHMPKTRRIVGSWNQEDKDIRKKERDLFRVLNPNKDPFNHNGFMELRDDSSPLFELEKDIRIYVIAGWASKSWKPKKEIGIIGDYCNEEDTGTELIFYDENKNCISKKKLVFPSSKKGIPIADMSSLIFTRKKYLKNPLGYIGYYDFKNNNYDLKHILNHVIIHFSKFEVPKKAKFIRLSTRQEGFFTLINIFPFNKLDINFIRERMTNIGNKKFAQDKFFPLINFDIKSIDTEEFKKINKILNKASFEIGKNKQILLQNAISKLIKYSYYFNKKALSLIKKNKELLKIIKIIPTINESISYISYCLTECPAELSKKINKVTKDSLKFYKKIIPLLIKKIDPSYLGLIFQARYTKTSLLFEKKDYNILRKGFKKILSEIELIKEPFNKIRITDSLKNALKQGIERDLFSEKTKKYFDYITWLNNQRIKTFNELALKTIEFENKKNFNREYIANKYKVYETLSTYYQYQNILYKTEYYKNTSKDKEGFIELGLMLDEFKNRIL